MKKILILFVAIFATATTVSAQTIVRTVGITYTEGTPTHTPSAQASWIALDTVSRNFFEYSNGTWVGMGERLQSISGCAAPAYTPTKAQSTFVVNACDSLYGYRGGAWRHLNKGGGGAGVTDGPKGDIDVSSSGTVWTVDTSAITAIKIASGAVTMPKIAQSGAAMDQVIKWNGSAWAPASDATGGVTDGPKGDIDVTSGGTVWTVDTSAISTIKIANAAVTAAKLNQMSATSGQVLKWNGSAWAPASDATGGVTDGDKGDIDVTSGGTIWTVDTSAITTVKIADAAVTWLKLAQAVKDSINASGGGGGTPGGATSQIQYNNSGAFDGADSIVITETTADRMGVGTLSPTARLHVQGTASTGSVDAFRVDNAQGNPLFEVENRGRVNVRKDTSVTTQSSAVLAAISADANTSLVLSPKGTGAIIAGPPPNGTATGGNARGPNAVDLQILRTLATQVASGLYSTIGGGIDNVASNNYCVTAGGRLNISSNNESTVSGGLLNTASGFRATVGGGEQNVASGAVSTVSGGGTNTASAVNATVHGGLNAIASLYGQSAYASGRFAANSDAQISFLVMRRAITGTAQTELFLDGSSAAAILPLPPGATNARAWKYTISVVGICADAGNGTTVQNDVFGATITGAIKRVGSTTTLVGTPTLVGSISSDASMSDADVAVTANNTNESLRIQATPPSSAGTTTVTRWVAKIELVEVGR